MVILFRYETITATPYSSVMSDDLNKAQKREY